MKEILTKDDLTHLIFEEIYRRYSEPKTRRKAFAILESAISCYDKRGFDSVTLKMIARESGLTAPSLKHYFSDLDEIRELAVKYVHMIAQKIVVDAMVDAKDPKDRLAKYLNGHYIWAKQFKRHVCVWISFISFSSRKKKDRALNTEAVLNGAKRISEMLSRGRRSGVFKHKDDFIAARVIQTLILGWLTTIVTEDITNIDSYTEGVFKECFRTVETN
tara:strand:+ start:40984 stop:41637 length:654 start_codon:yes stop_codon:yes gene_type:complete